MRLKKAKIEREGREIPKGDPLPGQRRPSGARSEQSEARSHEGDVAYTDVREEPEWQATKLCDAHRHARSTPAPSELALEVIAGLAARPPRLPCRLLYDAVGSALFEAITHLPEYGLARADQQLLGDHAADIAAALQPRVGQASRLPIPRLIIELGAGAARKTRPLLRAIATANRQTPEAKRVAFDYTAVDISPAALRACRRVLAAQPGLGQWHGIAAEFLPGLERAAARRAPGQPMTVLFLGSTIGNLTREDALAFLRSIHDLLAPGDTLLLGTDGEHNPARLLPAYDDPAGVTAAFNRNLLTRLQRELGAELDPAGFAHEARWNAAERRVEMHLRALGSQMVSLPRASGAAFSCRLAAGETIWTEASYKYTAAEARGLGANAGFTCLGQWLGQEWPAAETLLLRA